ncbi:hypothetical protein ACIQZI_12760 [Peribacillus sp. NPDC096379]|uniref:hypothetical protein n=1 Tax=Peribacillus sp. NPDC096379 TaxID=3364393 RepID=UPI0037FBA7DA
MSTLYNIDNYKEKLIELTGHSEAHVDKFIETFKARLDNVSISSFRDAFISYEAVKHNAIEVNDFITQLFGRYPLLLGRLLIHLVEEELNI